MNITVENENKKLKRFFGRLNGKLFEVSDSRFSNPSKKTPTILNSGDFDRKKTKAIYSFYRNRYGWAV